jgi:hypothetical protein
MGTPMHIELTLVSHTNAGKTTLARTLLLRDVGEVRDAPHVTEVAQTHVLLRTEQGDELRLCDTPGFGDSVRLAKRLRHADNPIGWLLREVWDRHRNRPLWCSQQAIQAARDSADVVLYVVNAAEHPRDAGYVAPELQILGWIGKPVVLLLNQSGPPRTATDERAEEDQWRDFVAPWPIVRDVMTLDAFARCWVQEDALFARILPILAADRRDAFARLMQAWRRRSLVRFDKSIAVLAKQIFSLARDRETLPAIAEGRARSTLRALGFGRTLAEGANELAMKALAERADQRIRDSTDALIQLHGLEGAAAAKVLQRLREHYAWTAPVSTGKAAAVGGVVSGAVSGLIADLASGGLSLGAGLIAGALIGALGGAGLARGHNLIRGIDAGSVAWTAEFLNGVVRAALLRYLAVAHFGRGRGAYAEGETPAFWMEEVAQVFAPRSAIFEAFWEAAHAATDADYAEADLRRVLAEAAVELLNRLYPFAELSMQEIEAL